MSDAAIEAEDRLFETMQRLDREQHPDIDFEAMSVSALREWLDLHPPGSSDTIRTKGQYHEARQVYFVKVQTEGTPAENAIRLQRVGLLATGAATGVGLAELIRTIL